MTGYSHKLMASYLLEELLNSLKMVQLHHGQLMLDIYLKRLWMQQIMGIIFLYGVPVYHLKYFILFLLEITMMQLELSQVKKDIQEFWNLCQMSKMYQSWFIMFLMLCLRMLRTFHLVICLINIVFMILLMYNSQFLINF